MNEQTFTIIMEISAGVVLLFSVFLGVWLASVSAKLDKIVDLRVDVDEIKKMIAKVENDIQQMHSDQRDFEKTIHEHDKRLLRLEIHNGFKRAEEP